MYTFLVGNPPFEEKEVENTLKNIKANNYAFPVILLPQFEQHSNTQNSYDFLKIILFVYFQGKPCDLQRSQRFHLENSHS